MSTASNFDKVSYSERTGLPIAKKLEYVRKWVDGLEIHTTAAEVNNNMK
jgi:hypothetical protein